MIFLPEYYIILLKLNLMNLFQESLRSLRDMLGATNKTTVSGSRRGASSVARSDGTDSRDGNDRRR